MYGGAIFVAVAQSIFSNKLIELISENIPNLDPHLVINSGATSLRNVLTIDQLTAIIPLFMTSLRDTYVVPIVLNGLEFVLALMLDKNMRIKGGMKEAATPSIG